MWSSHVCKYFVISIFFNDPKWKLLVIDEGMFWIVTSLLFRGYWSPNYFLYPHSPRKKLREIEEPFRLCGNLEGQHYSSLVDSSSTLPYIH